VRAGIRKGSGAGEGGGVDCEPGWGRREVGDGAGPP
jgi:hypothetical protein